MAEVKLEAGEEVLGSWTASIPFKRLGLAKEGGTLTLTNRRLFFATIDIPGARWFETIPEGEVKWRAPLRKIRSVQAAPGKRAQLEVDGARTGNAASSSPTSARR